MAHRSQCSFTGDVDNDSSHVPPHYKEYYRIAIDVLAEEGIDAYYRFLVNEKEVDFLSTSEIEHINKHLKKPAIPLDELEFLGDEYDESDSSGTYWPVHTDIAAPALDLGWPSTHMCRGPSDVTIFVHPPAPDALSIKEEVRRLIRSATQVIAIVMDVFTDIDLFDEVLEAASHGIPVYLLLDEFFSHHFLEMVKKCRVNLSRIHFLRVRTLSGSTYYCKSGMSFTGNLIERFMLVDCNAVLCGSYSFMWSFEKIHRSIVQRFQGELVAIFDEEFRILFAQSSPLPGVENAISDLDNYYTVAPYQPTERQQRKPKPGFGRQEDLLSQHSGYSWAEPDSERFPHNFRQDDGYRQHMEGTSLRGNMKQFAPFQKEKMQFDPTSSAILRAKRMEMNSYKRKSYAEGTLESFEVRDHQFGRITEHYDELDARSEKLFREKIHPLEPRLTRFNSFNSKQQTGGQGMLERFRQNRAGVHQFDEVVDQPGHRYRPRNYDETFLSDLPHQPPLASHEPSNSSKKVCHGSSDLELVSEGRLGLNIQKRPNLGQSYACQKSPTQKQVLDPKMLFQESSLGRKPDDQPTKHGLRKWRLGSYLGAYQEEHRELLEEGFPAPAEAHDSSEVLQAPRKNSTPFEAALARDPLPMTSYNRLDLYSSKFLKSDVFDDQSLSSDKGKEERGIKLAKHESMRNKINPMLQRSSRLRSSLIFSSSKIEQHVAQKGKSVLSIREQAPNEAKELEEAELQENSSKRVLGNEQADPIRQSALTNVSPSETAKTSGPSPKEVLGGRPLDLDLSRQLSDSGLGGRGVPDVNSSAQPKTKPRLDLQLSKKVQDVINKMTRASLASEMEKSAKVIHSPPAQPDPQPPPQPCPPPAAQPGPQPSQLGPKASLLSAKPFAEPGPQPSQATTQTSASNPREFLRRSFGSIDPLKRPSSTSTLEEVQGNSAKAKLHSSAACLDTQGGKGDKAGEDSGLPNLMAKAPAKWKSFLSLAGDAKSKETPVQAATETAQSPETTPKSAPSEAVPPSAEKEEKAQHRPPTIAAAPKAAPTGLAGRYGASASNALYSSNLRDDTKVILEQISANSQKNRAESAKSQQAAPGEAEGPAGPAELKAAPESDRTDSDKKQQSFISSRFESLLRNKGRTPLPTDQTDPLIKKMDSFRKERRAYSRFEVFYKKDEPLKTEESTASQHSDGAQGAADGEDKRRPAKLIPKFLGTLRRF
uniref:protein FAM83H n=1 Tax=Pristiophorus japonicus TaxID=55135 RepID=UPI00398F5D21